MGARPAEWWAASARRGRRGSRNTGPGWRTLVKLALVSDAWKPQVNGVARTLAALEKGLTATGHRVVALTPDLFHTLPCPSDPEVRLAIRARRRLARLLEVLAPDAIHIATEGP